MAELSLERLEGIIVRRVEYKGCATVFVEKYAWGELDEATQAEYIKWYRQKYVDEQYEHFALGTTDDELFGDDEGSVLVYTENLRTSPHKEFARDYTMIHIAGAAGAASQAYAERDILVRALVRIYGGGTYKDATAPEGWQNVVCTDIPGVGQCAWHYPDSERKLFADLPEYTKPYDGHTTEDKYERIIVFSRK